MLLNQKSLVISFIKNTYNSNFLVKKDTQKLRQCIVFIFFNVLSLECGSSTCSSVINVLDLENQISCCQNTFLRVNSCVQNFLCFKLNIMIFLFIVYYRRKSQILEKPVYYCTFKVLRTAYLYQICIFPFCRRNFWFCLFWPVKYTFYQGFKRSNK